MGNFFLSLRGGAPDFPTRRSRFLTVGLLLILCFLAVIPCAAAGVPSDEKVIIFVVDRMSVKDLKTLKLPNFQKMARESAIGLFSAKVVGRTIPASTYLTLGSSGKSTADGEKVSDVAYGSLAFQKGEKFRGQRVEDLYFQLNGKSPGSSSVMNVAAGKIAEKNAVSREGTIPGILGTSLNGRTAVFGNSDYLDQKSRDIASILMDKKGLVSFGDVSDDLLLKDPTFPGGVRTDPDKLFEKVRDSFEFVDAVAIDWGDLSRVENLDDLISKSTYGKSRVRALTGADQFLGKLSNLRFNISRNGISPLLIVISPTPATDMVSKKNFFSFLAIKYPDGRKGLLTSNSTRRPGIVTNTDFPVTVLDFLGIPGSRELRGEKMSVVPSDDSLNELVIINDRAFTTDQIRQNFLPAFVLWYAIVSLILLRLLLFETKKSYWIGRTLLLTTMSMPLILLLMPFLGILPMPASVSLIAVSMLLLGAALALTSKDPLRPILIICGATALALFADIFSQGFMLRNSALSYCPIAGFRYYGIGNEYMGVLIASSLMVVAAMMQSQKSGTLSMRLAVLLFPGAILVAVLGLPSLGSEFGGAAAAVVGFGYFMMLLLGVKPGWRHWSLLLLVSAVLLGAIFALNAFLPSESQSHIGRAAVMLSRRDVAPLANIISRKIDMNLRTTKALFWNWVVIISILVVYLIYSREKVNLKSIFERYPYFRMAFQSSMVVALFAYLLNDSGITAAAMIMVIAVPSIGYLLLFSKETASNK